MSASDHALNLALRIDRAIKDARPDDWRGISLRERMVKGAPYTALQNATEVERLFPIIKAQTEYR